jgi:insertion element IS1 protein InsB
MRFLGPHGPKYLLMECNYCKVVCKKAGKQRNGTQKYQCKACRKYQQATYCNKAYEVDMNARIVAHLKEGCGIWNMVRLLHISKSTVISRIKSIAAGIKPMASLPRGGIYEVDELHTFVGCKRNDCYVSYAMCRATRCVGKGSIHLVAHRMALISLE